MSIAYVALLRGMNVGGRNRLAMPDLADLFTEAGCCGVHTYIQSGNVLFTAGAECALGLPDTIAGLVRERFGFRAAVFLRTAGGVAHTKLTTGYFDSKLRTVSTARNWHTVTKLHDLRESMAR